MNSTTHTSRCGCCFYSICCCRSICSVENFPLTYIINYQTVYCK